MSNAAKSFDILTISLNVLHNYFNGLTKLLSGLYLTKFLDRFSKIVLSMQEYLSHACPFVSCRNICFFLFANIQNTRDGSNSVRIVKQSRLALLFRDTKVNVWRRSLNHGCRLTSLEAAEYL